MPSKKSKVSKKTNKPAKKTKKVETPVAPPVVAAPPSPPVHIRTEAEVIWDEIKTRPILMFGLPDQTVAQHCTFVRIEPNNLYVTIRSSATLPSLETAVAPDFTVELADKFVIIKRVPKPLVPSKKR